MEPKLCKKKKFASPVKCKASIVPPDFEPLSNSANDANQQSSNRESNDLYGIRIQAEQSDANGAYIPDYGRLQMLVLSMMSSSSIRTSVKQTFKLLSPLFPDFRPTSAAWSTIFFVGPQDHKVFCSVPWVIYHINGPSPAPLNNSTVCTYSL